MFKVPEGFEEITDPDYVIKEGDQGLVDDIIVRCVSSVGMNRYQANKEYSISKIFTPKKISTINFEDCFKAEELLSSFLSKVKETKANKTEILNALKALNLIYAE